MAEPDSYPQDIDARIHSVRGHRVILDRDLAELYEVETKVLNKAVKRHVDRFPTDFMFKVSVEELGILRFQSGTSSPTATARPSHGGRRYLPYAFTEEGVAMLSGILNSRRAILVNIEIMRAFVRHRRLLSTNAELARQLEALERKYDTQFKVVFDAIRELMTPRAPRSRPIGFVTPKEP